MREYLRETPHGRRGLFFLRAKDNGSKKHQDLTAQSTGKQSPSLNQQSAARSRPTTLNKLLLLVRTLARVL